MKTLKLALIICFSFLSTFAFSQDSDVTFRVNMQNEVGVTDMNVFGSFSGWDNTLNPLTNTSGTIWEATVTIPNGDYEFKYTSNIGEESLTEGDPCTISSFGFTNRTLSVTENTVLDIVCYRECDDCSADIQGCTDNTAVNYNEDAVTDNGTCEYLLTVTVDMSQVSEGFTTPEINGNYNGWCGGCNPLSDNGDGTWTGTFQIPNGDIEYKFAADSWNIQEDLTGVTGCVVDFGGNWNRVLTLTGNTTVDVVCWGSCDACPDPASDVRITSVNPETGDVTLTNIGNATEDLTNYFLCNFPAYSSVSAQMGGDPLLGAGEELVLNWGSVSGADGELGLYSSPSDYSDPNNVVDYMEWGFTGHGRSATAVSAGVWNTGDFVSGAAPYTFTGGQGDYGSAFWSEFLPLRNITFTVDLSNELVSAMGVHYAGTIQGWDAAANIMTNNGDGTWSITFAMEEGQTYDYQFINGNDFNQQETVPSECGVSNGLGGFNRTYTVGSADETLPTVCFSSCGACLSGNLGCTDGQAQNFDPAADTDDGSCTYLLTVTVDMSQVTDPFTQPETNGNVINGWAGTNAVPMTDNGDGTWTGTFTVPLGQVEYKFAADAWTIQEDLVGVTGCVVDFGGNWNRVVQITGDTTVDTVCWGSCDACSTGAAGCTDQNATNYDSEAVNEDGSCLYLCDAAPEELLDVSNNTSFDDGSGNSFGSPSGMGLIAGGVNLFGGHIWDVNTAGLTTADFCISIDYEVTGDAADFPRVLEFRIENNGTSNWNHFNLEVTGPGTYTLGGIVATGTQNGAGFDPDGAAPSLVAAIAYFPGDGAPLTSDLTVSFSNLCVSTNCGGGVLGCTDAEANNFNAAADTDDGSCLYDVTFNVDMNCFDGNDPDIEVDGNGTFTTPAVEGPGFGWCGSCVEMEDPDMDGIWTVTVELGAGIFEYKYAHDGFAGQEQLIDDMAGGADCAPVTDFATFANRQILVGPGAVANDVYGSCSACDGAVEGCTDPLFVEFDPYAEVEDGSCLTPVVEGCAYPDADNFNPAANTDDESCIFSNSCPGDFNGDDAVTVGDLSGFLAAFGTLCD